MDPIEQPRQQALVIKCQFGDRDALAELFLRHNRGWPITSADAQPDDVADVQREIWLAVIPANRPAEKPEAFLVWLYQIARSKANTVWSSGAPGTNGIAAPRSDRPITSRSSPWPMPRASITVSRAQPRAPRVLALPVHGRSVLRTIAEVTAATWDGASRLHYASWRLRRNWRKNE